MAQLQRTGAHMVGDPGAARLACAPKAAVLSSGVQRTYRENGAGWSSSPAASLSDHASAKAQADIQDAEFQIIGGLPAMAGEQPCRLERHLAALLQEELEGGIAELRAGARPGALLRLDRRSEE